MQHLVAHAVPPHLLIHDWREARALRDRLVRLGPLIALVIMPDHVHLVLRRVDWSAWLGCLSGYARWRNHHRQERGPVWLPAPPPQPIPSRKHLERTLRYVHLNPCRDGLARDPLAWPWSTHRDVTGLALPGVIATASDPPRLHAYVSSDPSVAVTGTELPFGPRGMRDHAVDSVVAAVSAVSRRTLDELQVRGPARSLLIQALTALTPLSKPDIAGHLGLSRSTIQQTRPISGAALARLERVLGDSRFAALTDHCMVPVWEGYRARRIRSGAYDLMLERAQPRLRRRPLCRRPALATLSGTTRRW